MIIINTNDFSPEDVLTMLTSTMHNVEEGRNLLTLKGEYTQSDSVFNPVVMDNGISSSIRSNAGHIIFSPGGYRFCINSMNHMLSEMEKMCAENGCPSTTSNFRHSTDYIHVEMMGNLNEAKDRKIIHCNGRCSNKKRYSARFMTWNICNDLENLIQNRRGRCNTLNGYITCQTSFMSIHNTIILDADNIFNTSKPITFVNDVNDLTQFTNYNRYINDIAVYIRPNGDIAPTLYSQLFDRVYDDPYYVRAHPSPPVNTMIPVFNEQWDYITPRGCDTIYSYSIPERWEVIHKLLNSAYDAGLALVEEKKDVLDGKPPSRTDICHICYMQLYDSIYVLESPNCQICVCAYCLHDGDYGLNARTDMINNILVVQYPESLADVVNRHITEPKLRDLLIHLMGNRDEVVNQLEKRSGVYSIIRTDKYVGYEEVMSAMLTPPSEFHDLSIFRFIIVN